MSDENKPIANPLIVLREEFDDWAILFDPDTGNAFGLSPTGVFIWKHLDGKHSINDIFSDLRTNCENVPEEAVEHIRDFVKDLVDEGLAGFEVARG